MAAGCAHRFAPLGQFIVESLSALLAALLSRVGRATRSGPHFLASPPGRATRYSMRSTRPCFASNVLGHYFLLRQLAPLLSRKRRKSARTGQAVWTGSDHAAIAARPPHFHWHRVQVEPPVSATSATTTNSGPGFSCCRESYGTSKAAVDMLNVSSQPSRWRDYNMYLSRTRTSTARRKPPTPLYPHNAGCTRAL